ncbi:MAG: OmpA family protein [Bacteroidetes bacterium]|nr:OmpA family protein [Bacteroidota bacterium]
MKKIFYTLFVAVLFSSSAFAQEDADKCKDSPMFPNRMPNFLISGCASNFDEVEFSIVAGGEKNIKKEGTKSYIRYDFNQESGKPKPSAFQILKNYENAVKSLGGITVFQSAGEAYGCYKIMKNGKESAWIKLECGGNENSDFYELTVLQMEEMKQDITSNDILNALNADGHIALYINFDSGKSTILPESQKTIDQVAVMLRENPALKISIEGHTDNVGTPAANLKLSEDRAKAVMAYLVSKKTDPARLAAKGLGQTKPITDNKTEENKAKNRRVEIVKQ